jgi:hypothetical protein
MGRRLNDIRIVDLKRTNVDWKKSDPSKGKYVFIDKPVYVDYQSDSAPLPDHKVQWVEHDPGNVDKWKYKFDYEVVQWEDQLYWPEGFVPNAEGRYKYRDVVLMMCQAQLYVERKKKALEKSQRATANRQKEFRSQAEADGVEVYEEGEVREMRKHLRG